MSTVFVWTDGEEEGSYTYRRFGKNLLRLSVYRMDDEEAELTVDYIAPVWKEMIKSENISKKVISQMTNAITGAADTLLQKGISGCSFVAKQGSSFQKLLETTGVVNMDYSEYMLKQVVALAENASEPSRDGVKENHLTTEQTEAQTKKSEKELQLVFTPEDGGFLVEGYLEGKPPVVSCQIKPYEDGCYLYEVMVKKEERGKGIGTKFLTELLQQLSEKWQDGEKKEVVLRLQVGSYNAPALHIYRKLGFETETEFCYYRC